MLELLERILSDFKEPLSFLFFDSLIALFVVGVYRLLSKRKARLSIVLLSVYLLVLIQTTLLSREPGSRVGIDLEIFGTWGESVISRAFFIENIIMMIPFGFLLPLVFKRMRNVFWCIFSGFITSSAIELLQLVTKMGFCQIDDVLTNTFGTLIGYLIWTLISSEF